MATTSDTIEGCNGSTYKECVENHGESWCNSYCVNADSNSTCNGDTYLNMYKLYGLDWSKNNCRYGEQTTCSGFGKRKKCTTIPGKLYKNTVEGCNGRSYEGCVNIYGKSICDKYCVNADANSTCNGDTYLNSVMANGAEWSRYNCKDKKGNLYQLTKNTSNFSNTSTNDDFLNNIFILLVLIMLFYLLWKNKKTL